MNRSLVMAAAVLCLAAGILAWVTAGSVSRREAVEAQVNAQPAVPDPEAAAKPPSDWLTEYTLTERSGRTFRSSQLDGQVHVVSLFFSSCPTTCRLQNRQVQEIAEQFGPQGVLFLSITTDPENDTPEKLREYARQFDADPDDWLFLTSDVPFYTNRVGAEVYQLSSMKEQHAQSMLVIDRQGEPRGRYHWNDPQQITEMRKMLTELLAEPPTDATAASEST